MQSNSSGERGVALFVALFALLIVTAIALGMMFQTDTETSISAGVMYQPGAAGTWVPTQPTSRQISSSKYLFGLLFTVGDEGDTMVAAATACTTAAVVLAMPQP